MTSTVGGVGRAAVSREGAWNTTREGAWNTTREGAWNTTREGAWNTTETAGSAVAGATDPFGAIEQEIRERSGGTDPQAMRDAAISGMRAVITGDQADAQAARERAAEALARSQNISIEEARAQVTQYEEQYRQRLERAKQQAVQAADTAAKATSRGAIVGFIALLLGAIAGWIGGRMGAVDPTMTADVQLFTARRPV